LHISLEKYYITSLVDPGWVACVFELPEIPPGKKFTILLAVKKATIFPVSTAVKYRSWDSWHVYIGTYGSRVTGMQEMHTIS
jgi:hypothetical protein